MLENLSSTAGRLAVHLAANYFPLWTLHVLVQTCKHALTYICGRIGLSVAICGTKLYLLIPLNIVSCIHFLPQLEHFLPTANN
uniref:Uncharacterized protein n=1 Tax=Rhizophora mucronata TaxID=61149 RepID=A0A2P2NZ53_RHIMU